jgi:Fis family transcriptional regulator
MSLHGDARGQMSSNDARGSDLPLRGHAERAFEDYLSHLGGTRSPGLYQRVMREVEEPLLRVVLRHADGNQTRAAEILGITRATLRRKLRDLGLAAD